MKYLFLISLKILAFNQLLAQEYPEMIPVKGGTFLMGDSISEADSRPHWVKLSDYKIARTETTVLQWKLYCKEANIPMPTAPDWGWKDGHPIVNVSFNEISKYLEWLTKKTGRTFRLPTEAEWEFAAREKDDNYVYSGADTVENLAWFLGNSNGETQPVGTKKNNSIGLFDMSGNVSEFCQDRYGSYSSRQVFNPTGNSTSLFRVIRGGSWYNKKERCKVTFRDKCAGTARLEYIGFRVVEI